MGKLMPRFLITISPTGDPRRTQDVALNASSAYNAGWLYRQLHPSTQIIAIRMAPDCRQQQEPS